MAVSQLAGRTVPDRLFTRDHLSLQGPEQGCLLRQTGGSVGVEDLKRLDHLVKVLPVSLDSEAGTDRRVHQERVAIGIGKPDFVGDTAHDSLDFVSLQSDLLEQVCALLVGPLPLGDVTAEDAHALFRGICPHLKGSAGGDCTQVFERERDLAVHRLPIKCLQRSPENFRVYLPDGSPDHVSRGFLHITKRPSIDIGEAPVAVQRHETITDGF